jgi:altronate hydrolase
MRVDRPGTRARTVDRGPSAEDEYLRMSALRLEDCALVLDPNDSVAVLKQPVRAGTALVTPQGDLAASTDIPPGHKIALRPINPGSAVLKYGQIIGFATRAIQPGDHVHTHNLEAAPFTRSCQCGAAARPVPPPPEAARWFDGFARPGGGVGTRNYLAVISVVNCSASVARYVRDRFPLEQLRRDFPNVDGVVSFTHKSGCGIQPGTPQDTLERVFAGLARHPNIGAYVMIGLGCEVSYVGHLRQRFQLDQPAEGGRGPVFLNVQESGGTRKTIEAASAAVARLLPGVNAIRRTRQPASRLILATNCGGSDGNSGITANPALGVAADELVRHQGTAVLAETPEIFGAEHLLAQRAVTPEVGEQLLAVVRWWQQYVQLHGATLDNNPSFGNKEGGLTTIYEKSLGAIAKAGQSPLRAVYRYAEPITGPGLCFMDTPGLDPVSMTGLAAGGCNVAVFTTGRGSVYGCKPVPCIKVATNTPLFRWMNEDMDLNAGSILDGAESVAEVGRRIFEKILAVAGGEKTKSELAGIGDEEFAPWILGPTF